MTTSLSEEKLKHKSLMYVFSKMVLRIVNVEETPDFYRVKCEDLISPGEYYYEHFKKNERTNEEVQDAIEQLKWITDGNEFPPTK